MIKLENTLFPYTYPQELKQACKLLKEFYTESQPKGAGWFNYPDREGRSQLRRIVQDKHQALIPYDAVVVLGIGGSYTGVMAIQGALGPHFPSLIPRTDRLPIFFAGHNLSELYLIELIEMLDTFRPIVQVISKSGTTLEPSVTLRVLRNYLSKRFGAELGPPRLMVVTDPEEGRLREMANQLPGLHYPFPPHTGGRYSIFTPVGLTPLVWSGYHADAFLDGAHRFYQELQEGDNVEHPVLEYAAMRAACWREGKTVDVLAYHEPSLQGFTEWWKQLMGESEGKQDKGLLPIALQYSTDLHSMGQYMQEGTPQMMETFLKIQDPWDKNLTGSIDRRLRIPTEVRLPVKDQLVYLDDMYMSDLNHGAFHAAQAAHSSRGVPCVGLTLRRLDEIHLGYLFSFFMVACSIGARLIGVNPYDQPGVEAYKKELQQWLLTSSPHFADPSR